jgi:hypothetical protein
VRELKKKKGCFRKLSCGLISLALLAVLAATWGFACRDIWLASTQWLLVATVLGIFALYTRWES